MRIGVDLGGTNIRVGLVNGNEIVKLLCEPCRANEAQDVVLGQIESLISRLIDPQVDMIGIGVPSVVDTKRGIVYNVANIPSWEEVHLKEHLEQRFNVAARVNNDCNCFALGVQALPQNTQFKDMVCVTLGTGVGSGIIINGVLYEGANTGAGEIGSVPYLDHDYEYYCSSRFFVDNRTTGAELFNRAIENDSQAIALWGEFGTHIGNLVNMIIFAYDPQTIVFGGSIAGAYEFFNKNMRKQINKFPYQNSIDNLNISCALVDNIGLIGATQQL